MTTTQQHFKLTPANANSANQFSYSQSGVPLIVFELPVAEMYLVPNSLKLNLQISGAGLVDVADSQNTQVDCRTGSVGLIQNLTISSFASRSVLEQIRSYGRLMSSVLPNTGDETREHSSNTMSYYSSENPEVSSQTMVRQIYQNVGGAAAGDTSGKANVSMPLVSGILSSNNPIPLSADWGTQGLRIEIELNPDSQFFNCSVAALAPTYLLSKVNLTGEYYLPTKDEISEAQKQKEGGFSYNAYTSLYSVVDSAISTHSFNVGLRNVIGAIMNFTPSNFVNTYTYNGLQALELTNSQGQFCSLQRVIWDRSGVLYPNQFQLDFTTNSTEPYAQYQVWNMLKGYERTFYNANGFHNNAPNDKWGAASVNGNDYDITQGSMADNRNTSNYSLAIPTDPISRVGVSYAGKPLGFTLFCNDLNDGNQNSMYLYVLARTTLMWKDGGLQVLS